MIRFLQNLKHVNVDATKKAKSNMKRGTFVKVNEKDGTFEPAATLEDVTGILVRDVVVDFNVSMGMPVSDYEDSQDIVKQGEFGGVRSYFKGERFSTTEYDNKLADSDVETGKYLTVINGKLAKPAAEGATKLESLGWITQDGNKLLGFKVV